MAEHAILTVDAVPIATPYKRKIGKVTFVVSSFGNPKATNTAQQMLLRLLEEKVTRQSNPQHRVCA